MDYASRHAGDKTRKRDLRKDQHEINKKLSCLAGYSTVLVENPDFFIFHLYSTPP